MKPKRLPGFTSFLCPYKKPENWRKASLQANQGNFYGQIQPQPSVYIAWFVVSISLDASHSQPVQSFSSHVMNNSSSLRCSSCGFSVFNRRYPNCERCGAQLPQDVAYSREEVAALRKRDMDEELARQAEKRPSPPGKSGDDSWLYFSFSGDSPDSSCSSDGGSCSGAD
ncbi:hypothetical protein [Polaromonas naphthalenivorans]|uniref:Uncharacterized protein n=1 Tax=Polaromonas naphthalenivorans (strain CJ2) TaxID=365044 RepID=A1VJ56_POLNA|nr:hypothetical protein [Polaromonas naphthalenivorans]ABM35684.1 hypothetical protein Pnap_0361 [Polaromonas naphthalenivorans CJ2]